MKHLKLIQLFSLLLLLVGCQQKTTKKKEKKSLYTSVNYSYPADSTTINKWISNNNFTAMYKHSWSVWKHLTTDVGNGKLAYQTWSSPAQIIEKLNNPSANSVTELSFKKPVQFGHAMAKQTTFDDTDIVEVVAYNKAAEDFAIKNKIFYLTALKKFQNGPYSQIPDFPNDAITIKPVYKIITTSKLTDGIYTMASWNGPEYKKTGFPESEWESCIHIDTKTTGTNTNGRADYTCDNKTVDNTYFLDDFIHFKISAAQAITYNTEITDASHKAKAGDTAILVGMHVTTKEIKRWVWQSFWWSPSPLTPNSPSSNDIAASRNGIGLVGAANHYAMDIAYSMVIPAQPYVGGKNEGELVIAYNPYLESGFGEGVFSDSESYVYNNGNKVETDLGVTTNCMTCHMAAAVNTNTQKLTTPPYFGDKYLSYKDPIFKDNLMLDFAWSVDSNIVKDK